MPVFVYALIGGLIQAAGTLVGQVLIALGMTVVTVTGLNTALSFMTSYVMSHWSGLPSAALQILGALRVGTDIGILVGAVNARLVLSGLSSNSLSFWVMRGKVS